MFYDERRMNRVIMEAHEMAKNLLLSLKNQTSCSLTRAASINEVEVILDWCQAIIIELSLLEIH